MQRKTRHVNYGAVAPPDAATIALHVNPLAPPPAIVPLQPLVEPWDDRENFLDVVGREFITAVLFNLPLSPELLATIEKSLVAPTSGTTDALAILRREMARAFVSGREEDEAMLENIGVILMNGKTREGGRLTKEWSELGFQDGTPPPTSVAPACLDCDAFTT